MSYPVVFIRHSPVCTLVFTQSPCLGLTSLVFLDQNSSHCVRPFSHVSCIFILQFHHWPFVFVGQSKWNECYVFPPCYLILHNVCYKSRLVYLITVRTETLTNSILCYSSGLPGGPKQKTWKKKPTLLHPSSLSSDSQGLAQLQAPLVCDVVFSSLFLPVPFSPSVHCAL